MPDLGMSRPNLGQVGQTGGQGQRQPSAMVYSCEFIFGMWCGWALDLGWARMPNYIDLGIASWSDNPYSFDPRAIGHL
jgi:hypothetical protein